MSNPIDFTEDSVKQLSNQLHGKMIESVELDQEFDDFFTLNFTDGQKLKIRYDWIYDWELI